MAAQPEWSEHDALLPKLDEARRILGSYPGVLSVDLGIKETGGELTPGLAFRVYVSRKQPMGSLDPAALIPDEVLDVPTDVIELSPLVEHAATVQAGGMASNGGCLSSYGTLGCIAKRTSDNKIVVLSNQHVFEGIGEKIGQPGCVCLCCACGKIADVVAVAYDVNVDCAIALLRDGVHATNTITGLNADGTDGTLGGSAPATVGAPVWKRGERTGRTEGTVVSITFANSTDNDGSSIARTNQILVKQTSAFPRFSNHGDSGSVVVTTGNVVIGLLYGGWDSGAMVGQASLCQIAAVCSSMGISIISGNFQQAGVPAPTVVAGEVPLEQAYSDLRRLALESPDGRELVDLVTRHHEEVVGLVDTDRRVTIAWHRSKGPTWLAALVRSARVSSYVLPDAIEGVTRARFVAAMRAELERAGSDELRAALSRHGDDLAECLLLASTTRGLVGSYAGQYVR